MMFGLVGMATEQEDIRVPGEFVFTFESESLLYFHPPVKGTTGLGTWGVVSPKGRLWPGFRPLLWTLGYRMRALLIRLGYFIESSGAERTSRTECAGTERIWGRCVVHPRVFSFLTGLHFESRRALRGVVFRRGGNAFGTKRARCLLLSRKKQNRLIHALHGNPLFGRWGVKAAESGSGRNVAPPELLSESEDGKGDGRSTLEFFSPKREAAEAFPSSRVSDASLHLVHEVPDLASLSLVAEASASPFHADDCIVAEAELTEAVFDPVLETEARPEREKAVLDEERDLASLTGHAVSEGLKSGLSATRDNVWLLTKEGTGRRAIPYVARATAFRVTKKGDGSWHTWLRYEAEGKTEGAWEDLAEDALWRVRSRKDEESPPPVWNSQTFSVKRLSPPVYVKEMCGMRETQIAGAGGSNQTLDSSPALPGETEAVDVEEDSFPEGLSWNWVMTARIFPIKRIPRAVRLLWADVLVKALRRVLEQPHDERRWMVLFALPKLCLRLPKRGGRKKRKVFEAAPFIRVLLEEARAGNWKGLLEKTREEEGKKKKVGAEEAPSHWTRERVTSLVEEGQFTKAVQALDSAGMHRLDREVLEKLRAKHPPGEHLPACTGEFHESLQFDVDDVKKAVASFRSGTAPGGSRFRASYIHDALTVPAGDAEERLSGALTGVVNLLARGEAPRSSAVWIAGAPLYPLRKKDGGVRPVAVGEVLRRLVAKCFCAKLKGRSEKLFVKVGQVGVGVKGGSEAAVLAVREALQKGNGRKVVLKVDLENAFNSINREKVLEAVRDAFPELEAWYRFCYADPSMLLCEGEVLPFGSAQGVQQGDPLGPLLFALGLVQGCHALKEGLQKDSLVVWYLDDGVVVGEPNEIVRAWSIIQVEFSKLGLRLNVSKCEFFAPSGQVPEGLEGVSVVQGSGFELLGAPVGDKAFSESYVVERVTKIGKALKNLCLIDDPQIEMLLLRCCLGLPRFVFALRSVAPGDILEAARKFDELVSTVLKERFGIFLSEGQEAQARLPVCLGGLGLEKAEDIMESAFLGNVLATRQLVGNLVGDGSWSVRNLDGVEEAFSAWKAKSGVDVRDVEELANMKELKTTEGTAHPQRVLSSFVHRNSLTKLTATASSVRDELRLRAVSREKAGSWWNVVPVKQLGFKFDRDEFLALLKWWLGVPLYTQQEGSNAVCPEGKCGAAMDLMGDHAVVCAHGPSRISRHDGVNRTWAFALKGAGFAVKMEVYTDPGTMRRSADTLVDGWEFGKSAAHDWVVGHVLQKSAVDGANRKDPDFVLRQSESRKDSYAKQRCQSRGLDFVPLAMDTFGGMGEKAQKAIRDVVAHARIFRGNALCDRSLSLLGMRQRLQVAVMRGVARQLLRRLGVGDEDSVC